MAHSPSCQSDSSVVSYAGSLWNQESASLISASAVIIAFMTLSLFPALCPFLVWFPPSVPLSTPPCYMLTFLNSTQPYQPVCLCSKTLLWNLKSHLPTNYSQRVSQIPPQSLSIFLLSGLLIQVEVQLFSLKYRTIYKITACNVSGLVFPGPHTVVLSLVS